MSRLDNYEEKRKESKTTEPRGYGVKTPQVGPIREFCIQEHKAERAGLHHDFRFDQDGVAKSWVFPKLFQFHGGKSRLAIQTEDHPIEYMAWEGEIEQGYGKGSVQLVCHGFLEVLLQSENKFKVRIGVKYGVYQGEYTFRRVSKEGKKKDHWIVVRKAIKPPTIDPGR